MNIFPLYIDPGTGSAIFSVAIGIAATFYFLARGFFLKLGVFFFRNNHKTSSEYKYVIYAEDKRYWQYFEAVLDEFEKREIEIVYLTSSKDDPVFSSKYKYTKGKYIGTGNKAYAYLNFLSAEFVLTTTPNLDVFQWKRSKNVKHYSHMIHGAGGAVSYRIYSFDYFDSILIAGEKEIDEIRQLEYIRNQKEKQLILTGNTFFDKCSELIKNLPKEDEHPFTVLVSPSWGPNSLLSFYGEKILDPLCETGWRIIIRPHPQSLIAEKEVIDKIYEKYKNCLNIEWDFNHENIHSLSKSDIMMSDFSFIIFDYAFLFNKPVIVNIQNIDFRRLEAQDLEREPFYIQAIKQIGVELSDINLFDIKKTILSVSNNIDKQNIRDAIKNIMWLYRGEAGKRIADFMIQTAENKSA